MYSVWKITHVIDMATITIGAGIISILIDFLNWQSKLLKILQNLSKLVQIVKNNCQNVGQVMFPQRSGSLGWLFNVKKQKVAQWVSHSVSHSVSDKVTYWAVGWQLIKEYQKLKSIQTGPFYLNCQATGRASKNHLLTDA